MFHPLLCSMMFYSQCYKNWRIEKTRKIFTDKSSPCWWKGTQNPLTAGRKMASWKLIIHPLVQSNWKRRAQITSFMWFAARPHARIYNLIDVYRSIYNNLYIQVWDQPPSWNFSHHCLHVFTDWTFTHSLGVGKKETKHHCKFQKLQGLLVAHQSSGQSKPFSILFISFHAPFAPCILTSLKSISSLWSPSFWCPLAGPQIWKAFEVITEFFWSSKNLWVDRIIVLDGLSDASATVCTSPNLLNRACQNFKKRRKHLRRTQYEETEKVFFSECS